MIDGLYCLDGNGDAVVNVWKTGVGIYRGWSSTRMQSVCPCAYSREEALIYGWNLSTIDWNELSLGLPLGFIQGGDR